MELCNISIIAKLKSKFQQSDWLSDSYYDVIFTALRVEYNSQPLIFKNKMAASRFAQVSDEEKYAECNKVWC